MGNLVIFESAAKAKKVQKFLGPGWTCMASSGHVIDLPPKKFAIDIKNGFKPTWEVMSDSTKILKEIIKEAKKADMVYLMTDLDREGEAIAWHISQCFPKTVKYKRSVTNSITKPMVLEAIKNARGLDYDYINAYECRRILDRLVGFKCSYPVTMATGGRSVGRTQSAGLRILGERELEIQNFVPDKYWTIEGKLKSKANELVIVDIKKPAPLEITSEKLAGDILDVFKRGPIVVAKFVSQVAQTKPSAPFKTSTMQQAASTYLSMSPKQAMGAAQKLYEGGHITYHRTDSLTIVPSEMANIRGYIASHFSADYQTPAAITYTNKTANAQEAHEAIRPTDISVTSLPAGANAGQASLYKLIWKKTVSAQMANAKFARRGARFAVPGHPYLLGASGSKLTFDGFKKVWDYSSSEDNYLPDLTEGDKVTLDSLDKIAKETKPPSRYSEASFTKILEDTGIGRPSTFQSIPETLKNRSYITVENRSIAVTELGLCVMNFCIEVDFCFMDLSFSAKMEELLDEIAKKTKQKLPTLTDFWARLQKDLNQCTKTTEKNSKTDLKCPKCKNELKRKHSSGGPFYGCSNYPKCKYIAQIGPNGELQEKVKKEKKEIILSEFDCPVCKIAKMVKRSGKFGDFYGCSSWAKTKCKGVLDKDGKVKEPKWKKKKSSKDAAKE